MIRSTHQILQALLKEQVVSDEVLLTVVAEASNIPNSRPLTRNGDDAQDEPFEVKIRLGNPSWNIR